LQSWILPPPETSLRKQFDDLFYRKNLRAPLPAVETASFFNTLGLLKRRDILGILPGSFIFNEEHHSQLICLPTFQPLSLESICILRLKNASLSPASVAFVDSLREVLKRLSTDVFNGVRASI
jgi:DNA-binding transcriptional LysR family regulator